MKSEFCLDHLSHKHFSSSRDRKKLRNLKPLNHTEMRMLVHHVEKDGFHTLVELINQLTEETQSLTCPQPCREFPSECTRNTLVCSQEATKKKHYRRLWWINQHSKLQPPPWAICITKLCPYHNRFCVQMPCRHSQQTPRRCLPHNQTPIYEANQKPHLPTVLPTKQYATATHRELRVSSRVCPYLEVQEDTYKADEHAHTCNGAHGELAAEQKKKQELCVKVQQSEARVHQLESQAAQTHELEWQVHELEYQVCRWNTTISATTSS